LKHAPGEGFYYLRIQMMAAIPDKQSDQITWTTRCDLTAVDPVHRNQGPTKVATCKAVLGLGPQIWICENAVHKRCDQISKHAELCISVKEAVEDDVRSSRNMANVADGWMMPSNMVVNESSPGQVCVKGSDRVEGGTRQDAVPRTIFKIMCKAEAAHILQPNEMSEKNHLNP
jgi:hypothetical protein